MPCLANSRRSRSTQVCRAAFAVAGGSLSQIARTSAGCTDMMAAPPRPWKVRAAISQALFFEQNSHLTRHGVTH